MELYKLDEATRNQLIAQSRNVGRYKDTSRGATRMERKKYSKVANAVKSYNEINMNDLWKSDILQVKIPIVGETDEYTVTIKLEGVVAELQKNIKNNQNKFEFRTIIQALTKVFNTSDVYVKCKCPDFKYRFAHWNIVNNVSVDDSSQDPGPGKGITNPNDDKGRGCKHILLVLSNGSWMMKVASVIVNYCHFLSEKKPDAFLKIVCVKPKSFAKRVIITANSSSEGAKPSAKTTAASFADLTINAKTASLTEITLPSFKPNFDFG